MPRFDWSFNFGHILTVLTVLGAALVWISRFRDEQYVHRVQIAAIEKWIEQHDRTLATNLEIFQELRVQAGLQTQLLQSLIVRIERVE